MAGTQEVPVMIGGEPLAVLLRRDRQTLIAMGLTALVDELPLYADLPPEALNDDIAQAVRMGIDLYLDTLADPAAPHGDRIERIAESAARRAEEGIPLATVLSAYHVGTRRIVAHVASIARPEELEDFGRAMAATLQFLERATRIVTASYLEVRQLMTGIAADESAARLRALLDPERAGDEESAFIVLRLRVGLHPDEDPAADVPSVAGNRKLRRVRTALARAHPEALSSLTPAGGLVVAPVAALEEAWPRVGALAESLQAAAGADVHVVAARAPTGRQVAEAARIAGEVLDLVMQLGRPPGLHLLEDVAVEYQLTQPGPARELLAATLVPLVERPDLLDTLAAHIRSGQDRRATAAALNLHPNSVDYRLRRIHDLLDIDPTDRRQAVPLAAALLAVAADAM